MARFFNISNLLKNIEIPELETDHVDIIKYINEHIMYVSFQYKPDDILEYYNILRKGAADLKLYSIVRHCALAKTKVDMYNIYQEMKIIAAEVGMNMLSFPSYIPPIHHNHHNVIKVKPSFLQNPGPDPHQYIEPQRPSPRKAIILEPSQPSPRKAIILEPPQPSPRKAIILEPPSIPEAPILQITTAEYEEKIEQTRKPHIRCTDAELFGQEPYSCDSYDRLIDNL